MRRHSPRPRDTGSCLPDAAGDAVRAIRGAAFKAGLAGFSEATGYCAALAVEAAILELESGEAAAAKAVDAIEAAEWAVARGAEPALYSSLAQNSPISWKMRIAKRSLLRQLRPGTNRRTKQYRSGRQRPGLDPTCWRRRGVRCSNIFIR